MDVTLLSPGGSCTVPAGVLQFVWSVRGSSSADLQVTLTDDSSQHRLEVHKIAPGRLLLHDVPQEVYVLTVPSAGDVFQDGSTMEMSIRMLQNDQPVWQLVLPAMDVSGARAQELLRIYPVSPSQWRVVASRASRGPLPGASADLNLDNPAVSRGTYAARASSADVYGIAPQQRVTLVLVIDRSASMSPHMRSGALQDLLDLLVGINLAVGRNVTLDIWWAGHEPEFVRPTIGPTNAGKWVEEILLTRGVTSGWAMTPIVMALRNSVEPMRVIVISDGLPPDLDEMQEALAAGSRLLQWHWLVFARSHRDPRHRWPAWQDELLPLLPLEASGLLTFSSLMPEPQDGWLNERLDDLGYRNALVSHLMAGTQDGAGRRPEEEDAQ